MMESAEVKNQCDTQQKPMTYSESVKQAKPRPPENEIIASSAQQQKGHPSTASEPHRVRNSPLNRSRNNEGLTPVKEQEMSRCITEPLASVQQLQPPSSSVNTSLVPVRKFKFNSQGTGASEVPKKEEKLRFSSNRTPTVSKEQRLIRSRFVEKISKECDELLKSIKNSKFEMQRKKTHYGAMISAKQAKVREHVDQLNNHLLLLKPVLCDPNCKHQQPSCIPAHGKLTQLNDQVVRKVIAKRNLICQFKENIFIAKKQKETKKELIDLFLRKQENDENGFVITGKRRSLEDRYNKLRKELNGYLSQISHVENLCTSSGTLKAEEFMKNRIETLAAFIRGRNDAVLKIDKQLEEAECAYQEKRNVLNSLQDQIKKMRKEIAEPIINRIEYSACLKENLKHEDELSRILKERDDVQHRYGAVMEEYKALQSQAQTELNGKEGLFMDIISQVEEGRKNQLEHESMCFRINQMHTEMAVRNGFMDARQNSIYELTEECKELNTQLVISAAEEDVLRDAYKKISEQYTDVLFDICFYNSWVAAGEEMEEIKREKNRENQVNF